jgi:hypothetical protein
LAGGFILTSLIWASAMARIIDRRFFSASVYFAVGGFLVLFGVMHSPLDGDKMFLPSQLWQTDTMVVIEPGETGLKTGDRIPLSEFNDLKNKSTLEYRNVKAFSEDERKVVTNFALAYLVMAVLMYLLGWLLKDKVKVINTDEEFDLVT